MRCVCCINEAKKDRKLCQKCIDYRINYNKTHKKQRDKVQLKYRATHKKELSDYYKNKYLEVKAIIVKHYSNGKMCCNCCGENIFEFMTVDHIKGGGNKHRKEIKKESGRSFYEWLIKNNFPKGYQILCWNCNWSKFRHGICPHQRK